MRICRQRCCTCTVAMISLPPSIPAPIHARYVCKCAYIQCLCQPVAARSAKHWPSVAALKNVSLIARNTPAAHSLLSHVLDSTTKQYSTLACICMKSLQRAACLACQTPGASLLQKSYSGQMPKQQLPPSYWGMSNRECARHQQVQQTWGVIGRGSHSSHPPRTSCCPISAQRPDLIGCQWGCCGGVGQQ